MKKITYDKTLPYNHRKIWTEADDFALKRIFLETRKVDGNLIRRWTPLELSVSFGRTPISILDRLCKLHCITCQSGGFYLNLGATLTLPHGPWRIGGFYSPLGYKKSKNGSQRRY